MWHCANSIFDIHNPLGIKLLTRLRLGLSHLHEHKFRHCFQDTLNPLCECSKDIESTMHFFLHCTNFLIPRQTLFQKIRNIDDSILSQSETQLTQTLLYGNQNYRKIQMFAFWLKSFFCKKAESKTRFSWWLLYLCNFVSFLLRYIN